MIPPIFPVCAASPAVTALLGTSPTRLFPFDEAPPGVATPYAVWQHIGGGPENYLADRPDLDSYSLQVDVYATSGAEAQQVAESLRDVIEPHAYIVRWGPRDTDPDTHYRRISFDVEWHVHR